jgi:hypothetical protein
VSAISLRRIKDLGIKIVIEARHATAESDSFFRIRSSEEKSEHHRGQDEKTTKIVMISATIQSGQAAFLLPWKEFDWNNDFAFNR